MKNIIFTSFFAVALSTVTFAQSKELNAHPLQQDEIVGPVMTFKSRVVDYGEIKQHSEPLRLVEFTNTGNEPLLIKSARGSCGCTVPTWPKEPVMPGESGQIEIRYDTKRLGKINKKVSITTNESGEPHVLSVVGHIKKSEESESVPKAPENIIKKKNN